MLGQGQKLGVIRKVILLKIKVIETIDLKFIHNFS